MMFKDVMPNLESLHTEIATWVAPQESEIKTVSRYKGLRDGGGEWIEKPVLILEDAESALEADGVVFTFLKDGGMAEADITQLGFPTDWRCVSGIQTEVQNGEEALILELALVTGRGRFRQQFPLKPFENATLVLPIHDLPLGQGIQPDWEPSAFRIKAQWGETWPTEGALVVEEKLWLPTHGNEPVRLKMLQLTTLERESSPCVVDRFGQRIS